MRIESLGGEPLLVFTKEELFSRPFLREHPYLIRLKYLIQDNFTQDTFNDALAKSIIEAREF